MSITATLLCSIICLKYELKQALKSVTIRRLFTFNNLHTPTLCGLKKLKKFIHIITATCNYSLVLKMLQDTDNNTKYAVNTPAYYLIAAE